jgi:membrane-associated protein
LSARWLYAVLFLIIFAETGLVVTPFLPGDSLLFAVGAVAAHPESPIRLGIVAILLVFAAVLGDAVNYYVGYRLGPRVFSREDSWLLNKKHLQKAHDFYEEYGGITIILARFIPIVRTFAPFVAGIGKMSYRRFGVYNIVGGTVWILLFLLAGWWFGAQEVVQKNFKLVILAIIVISVLPGIYEYIRVRAKKAPTGAD